MFFNCGSTTIKAQFRGSVLLRETFLTVGFFKCSSLRSGQFLIKDWKSRWIWRKEKLFLKKDTPATLRN